MKSTSALSIREFQTPYSSLGENEIRILVLLPSDDPNAALRGRLEAQDLKQLKREGLSYEAISYTWGTHFLEGYLSLGRGHTTIPLNLQAALLRLRKRDVERRVWVDAACINMQDLHERGEQILRLPQIFGGAERVIVWLGEESVESASALRFLQEVTEATDVDDFLRGNASSECWDAVASLLLRPYFTRIWVVQEVALARRAALQVGSELLDWRVFEAAISIFDKRFQIYDLNIPLYNMVQTEGASHFISAVRKCHRRNGLGEIERPLLSLEELVYALGGCEASDPRDKIFALYALARDIDLEKERNEPDYSETDEDVYRSFFWHCIYMSKSLDTIFRPWDENGPRPPWGFPVNDRESAAMLIRAPGEEQRWSTNELYRDRENQFNKESGSVIRILGSCVDEVEVISETCTGPYVPASWFSVAVDSELSRMLLQESPWKNELPESFYSVEDRALNESEVGTDLHELIRIHTLPTQEAERWTKNLVKTRKLVRTRTQQLGLLPDATRPGDSKLCNLL